MKRISPELNRIYQGDALEVLRSWPDAFVQCVVTSPPYDNMRTYGGFSWDFRGIAKELFRVLVPGGVVCWNVADQVVGGSETLSHARQAIFFVDEVGFRMHDTMIYHKLNFSAPETTRYQQLFEYVLILSKGVPRVFNPLKDKPNKWAGHTAFGNNGKREADGSIKPIQKKTYAAFGMRGNVWTGPTRGQEEVCQSLEHPAMMPKWLARDLIYSWSNTEDIILDPMAGAGTTALVAAQLNRSFLGIELNPAYVKMAEARIAPEVRQGKFL